MSNDPGSSPVPSVPSIPPPSPRAAPQALQTLSIGWKGEPWSLAGLGVVNTALAIVTLGIYQFWGRTEVRKRIWSFVRIDGEPLAYTGTGGELFKGFLIVAAVVLVPLFLLSLASLVAFGPGSAAHIATQVLPFFLFLFLGGVAVYRARRYRLSRTTWRGIRGALTGNSWSYGWTSFWTLLLVPALFLLLFASAAMLRYVSSAMPESGAMQGIVALAGQIPPSVMGLVYLALIMFWLLLVPWRTTLLQQRIVGDMSFGSRPFRFTGWSGPLYARFFARWVGVLMLAIAVPTAVYVAAGPKLLAIQQALAAKRQPPLLTPGEIAALVAIAMLAGLLYSLLTAWYKAAEQRYFAAVTRFEGHPFQLDITARGLIWQTLTNWLIVTLSLGILRPVAEARLARYLVERLSYEGRVDLAGIAQSTAERGHFGEGMAQAFDIDGI